MIIKTPLTLKANKEQQDNLFNPPEKFPGGLFCTSKLFKFPKKENIVFHYILFFLWLFVKFGAWRKIGNEI